jgi:hypothetical protein
MTKAELESFIEGVISLQVGGINWRLTEILATAKKLGEEALAQLEPATPEVPADGIVALYHRYLPMLPRVKNLTEMRRRHLKRRWADDKERQNLEWWAQYFKSAARSDFLCGRDIRATRAWKADFDFFLQDKSMTKILEGAYGIGTDTKETVQDEYLAGIMSEQRRRATRVGNAE